MPADSVHCCITSPPYWGLRDYGIAPSVWGGDPACEHVWGKPQRTANANSVPGPNTGGKNGNGHRNETKWTGPFCRRCGSWRGAHGLEPAIDLYVRNAVEIFRAVHRVLRPDGTLWLNLGDSYGGYHGNSKRADNDAPSNKPGYIENMRASTVGANSLNGLKPKDLCGIPWRVAFALQADGWWLRSEIIWAKPNPMPESVTDRPTKSHEQIFLLTKSARYFFDAEAIKETADRPEGSGNTARKPAGLRGVPGASTIDPNGGVAGSIPWEGTSRNKRSVWTVATSPFPEAHFATFPPKLIEPCIKAGCPKDGTVLDPFAGAGTTGLVADRLQRNAILIEMNPSYAAMARRRIGADRLKRRGVSHAVLDREAGQGDVRHRSRLASEQGQRRQDPGGRRERVSRGRRRQEVRPREERRRQDSRNAA